MRAFPLFIAAAALAPLLLTAGAAATPNAAFTLFGAKPTIFAPTALTTVRKTETPGQVSVDKKTLTFHGKVVRLVANTGPDSDMLSYRIGGLRNPTLVVPRGATIKMLFVNTDADMLHNIRFGALQASWPGEMTGALKTSVGAPPLPHTSATALHGEEMALRAPAKPGTYAYFCTVRGHAPGGMWGRVIVR